MFINFLCPECGWDKIEAVLKEASVVLELNEIPETRDINQDDGKVTWIENAVLESFICGGCGEHIADNVRELKRYLEEHDMCEEESS